MNPINCHNRLFAVLLLSGAALAQTNASAKSDAAPEPCPTNVSGPVWESGELRTCSTFSNHPKFLLCDDELRTSIVVGYLNNKPIDREELIVSTEAAHAKRFLVQFSRAAWKVSASDSAKASEKASNEPPKVIIAPKLPFSKPDSPDQESRWDCSKEKTITCTFVQTFK
jgi:hypothetical protein